MSNATVLKKDNVCQIINILRDRDEATKPEIAQATCLSTVTVNNLVKQLVDRGLLRRSGFSTSNGGRKAQRYAINYAYGNICGVSIRTGRIVVGILDFKMKLLLRNEYIWDLGRYGVEQTINSIFQFIQRTVEEAHIGMDQLLAVGVNAPGPVDYEHGRVISLRGYPRWRNVDLAQRLSSMLNIPVYVDKDVNSGISLIRHMNHISEPKTMLYFSVEGGIGCGVMIQGRTYRGNRGIAGEIGHTTIEPTDIRCSCGNTGCLELFASDFSIIKQCRAALSLPDDVPFDIDDAILYYKKQNPQISEIFIKATRYIAIAIRNSLMQYDPDEIFIRCKWLVVNEALFFRLVDELYEQNTLLEANKTRLTLIHEEDFVLKSAAIIAWDRELLEFDLSKETPS